ncbi:MAG TPA: hypothetical protein DCE78_09510 [Bacteroidetes bacterium]|nr:hypothetical protein [Bacteroidota bacterium]
MFKDVQIDPYRELFPHLKQPHYYLNHAAFGVLSTKVNQHINKHLNERCNGIIESYLIDFDVIEQTRAKIATLINAPSPDNISFVTNTSEGLNLIAAGLEWNSGDRILLNDAEFPSNVYPYKTLNRHGVEVDLIPANNGFVTDEQISKHIKKDHKLIGISAVQFLSGYKIDLHKTGEIAQDNGSFLVVDAIQAIGNSKIDVQAMQIDGLVSGGLKWMMAPMGIGFVYISDKLREKIRQQYVGWLSVENPWALSNFEQGLNPTNRRYELGGLNIPGIYALNVSVDPFLELGTNEINKHLISLTDRVDQHLTGTDLVRFTTINDQNRTGIITYDLPKGLNGDKMIETLKARKVTISHRQGKIRFSPHYYNNIDDIDAALSIFLEVYNSKV